MLKTNLEKGIPGDDVDLLKRRSAFGSNTYPQKKGRSFWVNFVTKLKIWLQFFSFVLNPFSCIFLLRDYSTIYNAYCDFDLLDVPLGSLAGSYFDHIDDCCSGIFGTWYKDRGNLILCITHFISVLMNLHVRRILWGIFSIGFSCFGPFLPSIWLVLGLSGMGDNCWYRVVFSVLSFASTVCLIG